MANFWVADMHIGHKNILKYCRRPFANVHDMDEALIANWNAVVKPNDTVWNLGDVAFCCSMEYALSVMKRLNGTQHLITGNHDALAIKMNDIQPGIWASISDLREIIVNNQKMVLCHYPLLTWHHNYKGTWMLYGHVHGTLKNQGKSLDVGVDCWNYSPVSFQQLKNKMDTIVNVHALPKGDGNDQI